MDTQDIKVERSMFNGFHCFVIVAKVRMKNGNLRKWEGE